MNHFTVATWNVNSVNARLPHLLRWLKESGTDIALLQETKVMDEAFPRLEIEELGYNILFHGQKSYNGVAILSKLPMEEAQRGLPGMEGDTQARYLEAVVSLPGRALRVATVYVPNGESPTSEKFGYKMRFYDALIDHAAQARLLDEPVIFGGDYNCAPYPADVFDPIRLDGTTCYHPAEREKLRSLFFTQRLWDGFRLKHPDAQEAYSWWDYRGGGFENNRGYRIDHLLMNGLAADGLEDCWIDPAPRAWERPSDHTPVVGRMRLD